MATNSIKRFAVLLLSAACASGGIIPDDRLPVTNALPWSPGMPGGVPSVSVGANVKDYGAVGDGVTDDYSSVTNAIANATRGTAVLFPAGTYLVGKSILVDGGRSVVLRGAGATQTKIISLATSSDSAAIQFRGSGSSSNVVVAAYRGQTNVFASDTAGLQVGKWVTIKESQDPTIIIGLVSSTNTPFQAQNFRITSIEGTNIGISRPLYWDYTNASLAPYLSQRQAITNCGVESMTVECRSNVSRAVFFYIAANCWMNSATVTNASLNGICIELSAQCTVRGCSVLMPYWPAAGSHYGIFISNLSTDNLIEDNILDGQSTGIMCQSGASGNVIAYNYVYRGLSQVAPSLLLKTGISCHGDFPNYNLFEGNIVTRIFNDNFWGCNRANTFFRNWSRRQSLNETNGEVIWDLVAVRSDATNYFENYVGNVLCSPRDRVGDSGTSRKVWEIGEDYGRGESTGVDPMVESTMLRHGNFDYVSGTTNWDGTIESHVVQSSYYLMQKPEWFGTMAWPPIGPDVNVSNSITNAPMIPAQARFWGITYSSRPTAIRVSANTATVGTLRSAP